MIKATDIVVGTGKTAVKGALIITEYTGYLMDGTVFDASVHRGRPFECVIGTGRVIKGWDLGVLGFDDSGGGWCGAHASWRQARINRACTFGVW